ncbi:MAG: hypothetical protein WC029_12550 [Sulfuricella sp.]
MAGKRRIADQVGIDKGGSFARLDKMFNGEPRQMLETFKNPSGNKPQLDLFWLKA